MSHDARKRVLSHSKTKANWRVVMLVLAEHTNSDGLAWPGNDLIAKEANISTRTVRRVLNDLEQNGEITIEERGVGRGKTAVIRITPERGTSHDKRGHDMSTFTEGIKGDKSDHKRGQKKGTNRDEKGTNRDLDLYIEPLEPSKESVTDEKNGAHSYEKNSWPYLYSKTFYERLIAQRIVASATDKQIQDGAHTFDLLTRTSTIDQNPDEQEIALVMSWLLKPGNWWMDNRAIRTPTKLLRKHKTNDCTYYETIRSQFIASQNGQYARNGRRGHGSVEEEIAKAMAP